MSFSGPAPSLNFPQEIESGTPLLIEKPKHVDSDSDSLPFEDSESDSSIQDYDCSQPVYQWEKFDILNILINQDAIDRGFNRKIGGFYRRVEGEKRNNHPIWRNRFAYEIAKLDSKATCFDVCMPDMKSVMRIEETTYMIWVLSGEKFHLVQDDTIQFFFEYVDEAEAQLDHFIETYFKEEAKVAHLQPSFMSPTPRSPNNLKWSTKNLFNFQGDTRLRARSADTGIQDLKLKSISETAIAKSRTFFKEDLSRMASEPLVPPNYTKQKSVIFSDDDMWLHLPRRPSLNRTSSKETKEAIKKRRGQRTFVNQYMIDKTLATTGLGVVKLATDIIRKEKVVLKIFERSLLNKRDKIFRPGRRKLLGTKKRKQERSVMDNIMREMEIMKNLRHPNIVSALETIDDTESDQIFLVLEYVNGGTLTDYLSEPEDDMTLVRSFARDLLHGIAYLHEKRIIHGDIKPDNIFIHECLSGRKILKIGDFGVSKCMDDYNSFMSKIETTPAYQAPEEFGSSNFKAWPRDIWSVGIVLYQLAFGKHPIMTQNSALHTLFEKIQSNKIEYPNSCEAQLKDLLERMLKRDPMERITIQDIQVHDFITADGIYPWDEDLPWDTLSFRVSSAGTLPVIVVDTFRSASDLGLPATEMYFDDDNSISSSASVQSLSELLPQVQRERRIEQLQTMPRAALIEMILDLEAKVLLSESAE